MKTLEQYRELTDKGESAPRLLSRKNEAESIDDTANTIGFSLLEAETFVVGRADQTLPFIFKLYVKKKKSIKKCHKKVNLLNDL